MHKYARFALMIIVSTLVMFGLMYLNVFRVAHVHFSETRAFMALIMGSAMAVIMLGFMLHMFDRRRANVVVVVVSATVFSLALWLVRSQDTVGDVAFMRAMIPHHSIAILTSERAQITDPRVRKLADEIITSQRREIGEMEALIRDIQQNGSQGQAVLPPESTRQQASTE